MLFCSSSVDFGSVSKWIKKKKKKDYWFGNHSPRRFKSLITVVVLAGFGELIYYKLGTIWAAGLVEQHQGEYRSLNHGSSVQTLSSG